MGPAMCFVPVALSEQLRKSFECQKIDAGTRFELTVLTYHLERVITLFEIEENELVASGADGLHSA